eukprot:521723-Rhodomonas_salina.1
MQSINRNSLQPDCALRRPFEGPRLGAAQETMCGTETGTARRCTVGEEESNFGQRESAAEWVAHMKAHNVTRV